MQTAPHFVYHPGMSGEPTAAIVNHAFAPVTAVVVLLAAAGLVLYFLWCQGASWVSAKLRGY